MATPFSNLQSIEALKGTDKFLKVPRSGTFKNSLGFYKNANLCNAT
jgi:hypothetical protein